MQNKTFLSKCFSAVTYATKGVGTIWNDIQDQRRRAYINSPAYREKVDAKRARDLAEFNKLFRDICRVCQKWRNDDSNGWEFEKRISEPLAQIRALIAGQMNLPISESLDYYTLKPMIEDLSALEDAVSSTRILARLCKATAGYSNDLIKYVQSDLYPRNALYQLNVFLILNEAPWFFGSNRDLTDLSLYYSRESIPCYEDKIFDLNIDVKKDIQDKFNPQDHVDEKVLRKSNSVWGHQEKEIWSQTKKQNLLKGTDLAKPRVLYLYGDIEPKNNQIQPTPDS